MSASPSEQVIRRQLRKMAQQNPGVTYIVLRASNGEVAIVPENMTEYTASGDQTVNAQCRDMVKYAMSVIRSHYPSKSADELRLAESRLMTSVVVTHPDGRTVYNLTVPEVRLQLERVGR